MNAKTPWYEAIQNISRPVIYVALVAVILLPLIHPLGLPINLSPNTRAAFKFIDSLPEGSIIWQSIGFNPAVDAETWPQLLALSRHYMSKHLKIIYFPTMQEGGMYADRIKTTYAAEYGYEYGKDYAILPFKAGGETAIAGLRDFASSFTRDAYGTPLQDLPIFRGFSGMKDVAVIVPTTGGDDPIYYVRYMQPAFGTPVVAAGTAPLLPVIGPFISSGQIKGAVIGLSGAAEYEALAKVPGSATAAMDAQAMGHVLIVTLVLIGNVGFLFQRRAKRAGEAMQNG